MSTQNNAVGDVVTDAMRALNAANKTADDFEKQYVTAAINALNELLTADVTPRLASKIARFRKVLKDYADSANKTAKDANGKDVNDVYTV